MAEAGKTLRRIGGAAGLLTLGAVLALSGQQIGVLEPAPSIAAVTAPQTTPVTPNESSAPGFIDLAKAVKPAVVNITPAKTERTAAKKRGEGPRFSPEEFGFPWPFDRDFGPRGHGRRGPRGPEGPDPRHGGMGSGVIVSPDGYILTNNHVVENDREFTVLLPDKREFKGKLIGSDPKTDLAVLKIDAQDLPYVPWGDASKLQVGEYVLAVGNPFGLNSTVTLGIVSAVGRAQMGITEYEDFIQTDAAINPGNSGGALVNTRGELVGINTAIFSRTGGYQGIGFAVPTSMAKPVYESLVKNGKVVRGYLGVRIQNLTKDLAKGFGLKMSDAHGAVVSEVSDESPAGLAGLRSGDVIVRYDGKPVEDSAGLQRMVINTPVGATVPLGILRDGKEQEVPVKIAEQPGQVQTAQATSEESEQGFAGVQVAPVNDRTIHEYGLSPKAGKLTGVVVVAIEPGSPADQAGLTEGDIIREVNRHKIRSLADYEKATADLKKDEHVLLLINRRGANLFLSVNI